MRDSQQRSRAPGHLREDVQTTTLVSCSAKRSRCKVCFFPIRIKNDPISKVNMVMSENGETGMPQQLDGLYWKILLKWMMYIPQSGHFTRFHGEPHVQNWQDLQSGDCPQFLSQVKLRQVKLRCQQGKVLSLWWIATR